MGETGGDVEHTISFHNGEWIVFTYENGELLATAFFDTTYAMTTYLDFWRVVRPVATNAEEL